MIHILISPLHVATSRTSQLLPVASLLTLCTTGVPYVVNSDDDDEDDGDDDAEQSIAYLLHLVFRHIVP